MAEGWGAFYLDAALEQGKLKGSSGELGGVLDGEVDVETRIGRAPGAHQHGAGPALDAGMSGFAGLVGDHGVVERVVVDVGSPGGDGGFGLGRVGADGEADGVFVERESGDGGAEGPLQIVPGPGFVVGLIEEEGVVANDVAFNGAYAGLLNLLGEEVERVHGRERFFGLDGCG